VTSSWFFLSTLNKLQNCSCNQFHYIDAYKQVETNSMTKNRGGNNGSENWTEKNTAAPYSYIISSGFY